MINYYFNFNFIAGNIFNDESIIHATFLSLLFVIIIQKDLSIIFENTREHTCKDLKMFADSQKNLLQFITEYEKNENDAKIAGAKANLTGTGFSVGFLKRAYIRFTILWFSISILPICVSIMYNIALRYLIIKMYGLDLEMENPPTIPLSEVVENPKLTEDENNKNFKPSSKYSSYFPENIHVFPNNPTGSTPISTHPIVTERDPIFNISNDDILSETIIINPPLMDKSLPFEEKVDIIVPEPSVQDIIIHIQNTNISRDMFHSIYEPSFEGKMNPNYSNIFDLHLQVRDRIAASISSENVDVLNQQEMIEIVKKAIKQYLTEYKVYASLDKQNLRDRQHIINLLIGEMMANSIFCDDAEKALLHIICRALVYETICHVEGHIAFTEPRIDFILSRFLRFD